MKNVVFLFALLGVINIASAQIASNLSMNEKYSVKHEFMNHNLDAEKNMSESDLAKKAAGTSATSVLNKMKDLWKKKANKEEILEVVYSDPTLGRFIQDEDDVWKYLGVSNRDLDRLQLYLQQR